MTDERSALLESIAETIADYRAGEIDQPTPAHVDRWVRQFDEDQQVALLRELDHVLESTYFSRDNVSGFLDGLVNNQKLAGADPAVFWNSANFLSIQANGNSQTVILDLFAERLDETIGVTLDDAGSADGPFIYIDDVLFSGSRVGNDLSRWIAEEAPDGARVHVIVVATHSLGEWQSKKRLQKTADEAGKKVSVQVWRCVEFENRKAYRKSSEVLWPTELPDNALLQAYVAMEEKFPFEPRAVGGTLDNPIFSSEEGRALLERELLLAGVKILAGCNNPKAVMRPLGFSAFGLGFGSPIVTFRNCPNNCPLAFWWGEADADAGSALDWYPLFPRVTYEDSNVANRGPEVPDDCPF